MTCIGIIGNGPIEELPDLSNYQDEVDYWIGADRGALTIINNGLTLEAAVGDFDSVSEEEKRIIVAGANNYFQYPIEKDKTDLEIAIDHAITLEPKTIYLFGVSGRRLDHTLINIQLLEQIIKLGIRGLIIDRHNHLEMYYSGEYTIEHNAIYPTISFIPLTKEVRALTLVGFYYPLTSATIEMGSTLSISNKLISNYGTFSFVEGIVLVVKSRD